MSIQTQFNKFNNTISITRESDDYKAIREKDNSIKSDIKEACKEAGYPITSDFIQGSFATHTAIKSLSGDVDLDRGLIISKETSPDNPVDCKKVLKDVLVARKFKNSKIKMPCVTADYASLDLHLDYPVYREDTFSQLELAVGKEFSEEKERCWQNGDPKGLINWINGGEFYLLSSEQTYQYKRIIRYLKRWRDVIFTNETTRKKIYSIGLTVMAIECYVSKFDEETPEDLESILETVKAILAHGYFTKKSYDEEKYDIQVNLPKSPGRDIFTKHGTTVGTEFRNKLIKLRDKLQKALDEEDESKQCEILREVFGDDFPQVAKKDEGKAKAVHASPGYVADHGGA